VTGGPLRFGRPWIPRAISTKPPSPLLSSRGLLLGSAAAGLGQGLAKQGLAGQHFAGGAGRKSRTSSRSSSTRCAGPIHGNGWIRTPNLDELGRQNLHFPRRARALPTIPARHSIHRGMRTFPFRNGARRARRHRPCRSTGGGEGLRRFPQETPAPVKIALVHDMFSA